MSVGVFHEHLLSWEECIVVTGEVGVIVDANHGARGLWLAFISRGGSDSCIKYSQMTEGSLSSSLFCNKLHSVIAHRCLP